MAYSAHPLAATSKVLRGLEIFKRIGGGDPTDPPEMQPDVFGLYKIKVLTSSS